MTSSVEARRTARRFVLRALGVGTVLLAVGLAVDPTASAPDNVPSPPSRFYALPVFG